VSVIFAPGDDGSPTRVGYAVGRGVGSAVERNRVRRRLRAIVDRLELAPGNYLVRARPAARTAPFEALEAGMRRAVDSLDEGPAR
jgi:ribonuclease P protein component